MKLQENFTVKVLILGAAGSIGQAVTTEIFKRDPKVLHAVDISENNMVGGTRSQHKEFYRIYHGEFSDLCN